VRYDWPVPTGIIVGRLGSDDSRFLAMSEDEDLVALLSDDDPIGARIVVQSTEHGNRAALG
jgi:acetyl-CoA C-acetyltransferase